MKTISLFLFALLICVSCSKDNELTGDLSNPIIDQAEDLEMNAGEAIRAFQAKFYTVRNYSNSGEGYCDENPEWPAFNYQYAEDCGNATHMGNIALVEIQFCGGAAPGPEGIPYGNGIGKIVDRKGNEIHIEIPPDGDTGYVVLLPPGSDPVYDAFFETPFNIVGGTGKFINASGGGTTLSYVDLFDENGAFIPEHRTDHHFTGKISFEASVK